MSIDSEVRRIEPGDAVYIPPNAIQFLHNYGNEPIVFVCLVDLGDKGSLCDALSV
jgi:mannose-6-phosphate isomerase-like protein (cupin superfamily)